MSHSKGPSGTTCWYIGVTLVAVLFGSVLAQNTTTTTTTSTTSTTTPVPPPTTSTTPAPPKPDQMIEGNVTTSDITCIRYEFSGINLLLHYDKQEANQTGIANISIPFDAKLDYPVDICKESAFQNFSLLFSGSPSQNKSNSVTFSFASNSNSVYLASIEASVQFNDADFKNVSHNLIGQFGNYSVIVTTPNFNVEKTHSYSCAHVTVPKTDSDKLHVAFSGLRVQAFMDKEKNGQFSSEHNCQSEINDVVPIAVGAALTGLVIIVMVAYFIGRRRSRRLAYQSV